MSPPWVRINLSTALKIDKLVGGDQLTWNQVRDRVIYFSLAIRSCTTTTKSRLQRVHDPNLTIINLITIRLTISF